MKEALEQYQNVQRMLAQRMLLHAESILRQWARELDESRYYDRLSSLNSNYNATFSHYLSTPIHFDGDPGSKDDDERDQILDSMTREYFVLTDDLFEALMLKRHMAYKSDFRELPENIANIKNDNRELATAAMAQTIMQLVHYDSRIIYFPEIRQSFLEAIGNREEAYFTLVAIVKSLPLNHNKELENEYIPALPQTWVYNQIVRTQPEREKLAWVYREVGFEEDAFNNVLMGRVDIVQDDELRADMAIYEDLYMEALEGYEALEQRGVNKPKITFRIGWCALLVADFEKAERYMVARLREKDPRPEDYLNYAHLCFLRGDKVTAFEYYREAKKQIGDIKTFKEAFCPDRKVLADLGIPLTEIYLMEDNLLVD